MKLMQRLGEVIKKLIETTPAISSTDSDTINNKTPQQVASEITKADIGLGQVANYPIAKTWTGTPDKTVYATPKSTWDQIFAFLTPLRTQPGALLFVDPQATNGLGLGVENFFADVGVCWGAGELATTQAALWHSMIFEIETNQLYTKSGSSYVAVPKSENTKYLKPNRWYFNRYTNRLFYSEAVDSFISF